MGKDATLHKIDTVCDHGCLTTLEESHQCPMGSLNLIHLFVGDRKEQSVINGWAPIDLLYLCLIQLLGPPHSVDDHLAFA